MNYLDLYCYVSFRVNTVSVEEKNGNEIAEAAEAKKWQRPQSDHALMRDNTVNQNKCSLSIVSSCWNTTGHYQ